MQIHCLRVRRTMVGQHFPFDRIYLVNHENQEVIRRLFRFAIVMPLLGETLTALRNMRVDEHTKRGEGRGVETKALLQTKESEPYKLGDLLDLNEAKWIVVVPLLQAKARPGEKIHPKYLTSTKWVLKGNRILYGANATRKYKRAKRISDVVPTAAEGAFNKQAYLQTPDRVLRPPCLLCPRMIEHQNGECSLGDLVCYQALPLGIRKELLSTENGDE